MRTVAPSSKRIKPHQTAKKPVKTSREPEEKPKGPQGLKTKFHWFSVRLGLDMPFLFLVILLLIIGVLMMFSASYPSGFAYEDDSFFYLKKQLGFAAIGLAGMIGLSYLDYHYWHILEYVVLGFALIFLVWVLFVETNGVRRWVYIGPISFQPSEIAKLAVVLVLADWGSRHTKKMGTFKYGVAAPMCVAIVILVFMALEPHYSGMAIIIMLTALMLFISGTKLRWFIFGGIALAVLIVIAKWTGLLGYAMKRMDGWTMALNPTDELYWATYQTRNSIYAIGSGGFWGLGLGMSRQKYLYIPEVQNDFVFAVVCEELGFIGAAIILFLFGLLVYRGIKISIRAKDRFGSLLGIGLSAQIGIQVILNMLVITDGMPNTGISLPFFSYGGTSLIMLLAQMGIILSISRTSNLEKA